MSVSQSRGDPPAWMWGGEQAYPLHTHPLVWPKSLTDHRLLLGHPVFLAGCKMSGLFLVPG